MSDDNANSSQGSSGKSWFGRLAQLFQGEPQNRDDLVEVIQDAEQRELIDPTTTDMIEGVLEISQMRARDIMIPRSKMVTIDVSETPEQFLPTILESAHSRFPVICEDKDHVEGILLAKDLLAFGFNRSEQPFELANLLRPAVIIPESKKLDTLLKEFRSERYHMAIVVDEYGSVAGLVTIEDILELIVGEIADEHDDEEDEHKQIRQLSKHVFQVQAQTALDDFNEFFQTQFDEEEADTIGGIVLHGFSHMPTIGEIIELGGLMFKVTAADSRRLNQLQVTLPKSE